jgi:hypothetical protein
VHHNTFEGFGAEALTVCTQNAEVHDNLFLSTRRAVRIGGCGGFNALYNIAVRHNTCFGCWTMISVHKDLERGSNQALSYLPALVDKVVITGNMYTNTSTDSQHFRTPVIDIARCILHCLVDFIVKKKTVFKIYWSLFI